MENTKPTPPARFLRRNEVIQLVGLSSTTLHHRMKADFPKPISVGPRSVRWDEAAVLAWMEARRAAPESSPTVATKPARTRS